MPRKARCAAPCPKSAHRGSQVRRHGQYTDKAGGRWQRFFCSPVHGTTHTFRVAVVDEPTEVVFTPPPRCPDPEHTSSDVVRAGSYGKFVRRQRYRCTWAAPDGGAVTHWFTLPLPREWVGDERREHCHACDVLVGPHRGSQASSRRSSWPLMDVVDCLISLSRGMPYTKSSPRLA